MLERIERHHVTEWWAGRSSPKRIDPDWLRQSGIAKVVTAARMGAPLKRRTTLLVIGTAGPVRTIVAVSRTPDGRQPVLGFGADTEPGRAARSAISELFQMELAFFSALQAKGADRTGGHHAILARADQLQGPRAQILDGTDAIDWPGEARGNVEEAVAALPRSDPPR